MRSKRRRDYGPIIPNDQKIISYGGYGDGNAYDLSDIYGGGFDIVKQLNKIPMEFHAIDQGDDMIIRTASFLGPNTKLRERLENLRPDGTYDSIITEPINDLDRAALAHDLAYHKDKDLNKRHEADKVLMKRAKEIAKNADSIIQRTNAGIVYAIMGAKVKLGLGYDQIMPPQSNIVRGFDPITPSGRSDIGGLLAGLATIVGSIGIPLIINAIRNREKK